MKRIVLFLFLSSSSTAFSQINAHAFMIGGSLEIRKEKQSEDSKISNFSAQPYFGFFFSKQFLIGIRPSFLSGLRDSPSSNLRTREIGIGGFVRFYPFNKTKVLPFTQAGFQRINYQLKRDNQTNVEVVKSFENIAFAGVGLNFFISPNIALETNFEYSLSTTDFNLEDKKSLALRLGFQIFLNNK